MRWSLTSTCMGTVVGSRSPCGDRLPACDTTCWDATRLVDGDRGDGDTGCVRARGQCRRSVDRTAGVIACACKPLQGADACRIEVNIRSQFVPTRVPQESYGRGRHTHRSLITVRRPPLLRLGRPRLRRESGRLGLSYDRGVKSVRPRPRSLLATSSACRWRRPLPRSRRAGTDCSSGMPEWITLHRRNEQRSPCQTSKRAREVGRVRER